jgi:hypothetical protein
LPVVNKILPGPSDTSPEPDIQMPPLSLLAGTSAQRAFTSPAVETPNTQPS